jgi:hypothetical protein
VLDGAAEEPDRGERLLVGQDLDVGQAGGIVDGDVHELPADALAAVTVAVDERRVVVLAQPVADALARAALDAPELLDVDVDQLAGPLALVALRGLAPQPAELAHPDPGQDARHRRQRHAEQLGDLGAGEAQSP